MCLSNSIDTLYIEDRLAQAFAVAFGIAILFGIFIVNGLRILVLSYFAPRKARQLISDDDAVYIEEKEQDTCCCRCLSCLTLPQLAVDTALDVQLVFDLTSKLEFGGKRSSKKNNASSAKKSNKDNGKVDGKSPKTVDTETNKKLRSSKTDDQSQDDIDDLDSARNGNKDLEMANQEDNRN